MASSALPKGFTISSIFRVQSGFPHSASWSATTDIDGSGLSKSYLDFRKGRNRFTAPPFVNLDTRVAKQFKLSERIRLHGYLEFFNLLNRANPAAVYKLPDQPLQPFGSVSQVLPGREGQVGMRLEF